MLDEHKIVFRQGKEFFADRAVTISVFPDNLPVGAPFGSVTNADVELSYKPHPSGLPEEVRAEAHELSLKFGPADELGVPVEVRLETSGPNASRISGRGFATFKDIRVSGGTVDRHWDTFDTLRHVGLEYLQRTRENRHIQVSNEFGLSIKDPGTSEGRKTAFLGYELSVDRQAAALVKLQLLKDDGGWQVANELLADQIHDAHPLPTVIEGRPAHTAPEAVAARAFELDLQNAI